MPYYIKARKKVAEAAGLDGKRLRLADGNYMLWQNDLLLVSPRPLWEMEQTCVEIGALMLTPTEARAEQDCKDPSLCRPLPEAAEAKWQEPKASEAGTEPASEDGPAREEVEPSNTDEP